MIKRILITGSKGQLGNEIERRTSSYPNLHFTFTDLPELDIANEEMLRIFLSDYPQDLIVNCAAYTAVDKAEQEGEKAFHINRDAVKILSHICSEKSMGLIHISTDFVFDGEGSVPYKEEDLPNPLGVYAKSKYEGELAALSAGTVFRTSWLYSSHGHNFVKTILKLSGERNELRVVFDQVGTPTWAGDLADCLLRYIVWCNNGQLLPLKEIFHFSNEGVCSWYDFAREIVILSKKTCTILPIESFEYPVPAKRPAYSVLNKKKIKEKLNMIIPHWTDSLKICLKELNAI